MMALRDWLDPDYDPLTQAETPELANAPRKLATLANVSKGLANRANAQVTDIKEETANISKISKISSVSGFENAGQHRLEVAAQGLPATLDELAAFFADYLQSWGAGEVQQEGIRKALEWYCFTHKGRAQPRRDEVPAGMVRCTDCKQDRCKHVGRQSSPSWRWCSDYTAKVHQMTDYRRGQRQSVSLPSCWNSTPV